MQLVEKCCCDLSGSDRVKFDYSGWNTGCSDFGDVTCVMPGVQFTCNGAAGTFHGIDFSVPNPYMLCVSSAKAQLLVADALLCDDAAAARGIIENYNPRFSSIKEYFESLDEMILDKDAVVYDEEGHAVIDFFND